MARHVVFDFFGTLVSYRDGVRDNPVGRARAVLAGLGDELSEAQLTDALERCFEDLEAWSSATLREYSMLDAARLLFERRSIAAVAQAETFVEAYLEDWVEGVAGVPGLAEWLGAFDVAKSVLSNTHHEPMLRRQLSRLGIDGNFCRVTTSIGHGLRKPHASIYRAHLAALGVAPADAVFVGDNPACDYFAPRSVGMAAYLIAERPVPGVPEAHRLRHLFELEARLRS